VEQAFKPATTAFMQAYLRPDLCRHEWRHGRPEGRSTECE
jgi:hypothetical protein